MCVSVETSLKRCRFLERANLGGTKGVIGMYNLRELAVGEVPPAHCSRINQTSRTPLSGRQTALVPPTAFCPGEKRPPPLLSTAGPVCVVSNRQEAVVMSCYGGWGELFVLRENLISAGTAWVCVHMVKSSWHTLLQFWIATLCIHGRRCMSSVDVNSGCLNYSFDKLYQFRRNLFNSWKLKYCWGHQEGMMTYNSKNGWHFPVLNVHEVLYLCLPRLSWENLKERKRKHSLARNNLPSCHPSPPLNLAWGEKSLVTN